MPPESWRLRQGVPLRATWRARAGPGSGASALGSWGLCGVSEPVPGPPRPLCPLASVLHPACARLQPASPAGPRGPVWHMLGSPRLCDHDGDWFPRKPQPAARPACPWGCSRDARWEGVCVPVCVREQGCGAVRASVWGASAGVGPRALRPGLRWPWEGLLAARRLPWAPRQAPNSGAAYALPAPPAPPGTRPTGHVGLQGAAQARAGAGLWPALAGSRGSFQFLGWSSEPAPPASGGPSPSPVPQGGGTEATILVPVGAGPGPGLGGGALGHCGGHRGRGAGPRHPSGHTGEGVHSCHPQALPGLPRPACK